MRFSNRYCGKIGEKKVVSSSLKNGGGDGKKEGMFIGDEYDDGGNEEDEICEIETEKEKKNFDNKDMDIVVEKAKSEEDEKRTSEILIEKRKKVKEKKMINKIDEILVL